jgi:uncharacterized protein
VDIEDTIRSYYEHRREVAAVFLFGSRASGMEIGASDVDLGLVLETLDPDRMSAIAASSITGLGRVLRKDIHPVILNTAGETLVQQVLKGKLLCVNNPEFFARFLMVSVSRIAEFGYYRRMFQRGAARKIDEMAHG